jgi:transcriptional regulator with XRE-family HTH domain
MLIGERLRAIREAKKLSQGDVEHRTMFAARLHLARGKRSGMLSCR